MGMVDDGEATEKSSELADDGLVFMFYPLGAHPIGVFASHNSTRGTILAQLILQAIVLLEEAGAGEHSIICDSANTNRLMWTECVAKKTTCATHSNTPLI